MKLGIHSQPYDPWKEISEFQRLHLCPGSYGACSVFVGTMRDFNQNEAIREMHLQHYPGMTEKLLIEEGEQVSDRHELLELLVLHRTGVLKPDDPIVVVAAWSAHRKAAFDATREMMEYLKTRATFWKKEILESDHSRTPEERWVDNIS